jgi:tripartite ATP-independent transporter DctM subunit
MAWWLPLVIGLSSLLLLMFAGVPIFVAFLILNVIGILVVIGPAGFGMFANSIYTTATVSELASVPLFILMGEILFRSNAISVLMDSMDRLVGNVKGRQYYLCILLSAVCGALAGAAMAVAGLLGRSLYPTMVSRGYNRRLSAGTILGGASLDPIIPPSVLAIIIASLAKVSTGKILIAGVIPGLFLMVMYLGYVYVRLKLDPTLSPDISAEFRDPAKRGSKFRAVMRMLPVSFVFFMVVGLIMLGVATPTEAAATGVIGALLLTLYYGGFSITMMKESIISGIRVTGIMLSIMACAAMFSQLLIFTGTLRQLGLFIQHMDLAPFAMLCLLIVIPFLLFMFLDQVSVLMVLIPVYTPIIGIYEFDAVWFWTLILIVATVGGISPPFGYTLFAFKSAVPEIPTRELFAAAWPYIAIIMAGLAVMMVFPSIITFLPNLMRN